MLWRAGAVESGKENRGQGQEQNEDGNENEDWWRPYRSEFPVVRVRVGEKITASRGPDVGRSDEEVVVMAEQGVLPADPEYSEWLILIGQGKRL